MWEDIAIGRAGAGSHPRRWRSNMPITTTAGDTAPRMKPRLRERRNFISKIHMPMPPTATASATPGSAVRRMATAPADLMALKSSSSPERIRMMESPAARMPEDQESGSAWEGVQEGQNARDLSADARNGGQRRQCKGSINWEGWSHVHGASWKVTKDDAGDEHTKEAGQANL